MCGEKDHQARARTMRTGSPPRVRGKVYGHLQRRHERGITPACAGKSVPVGNHLPRSGDHPRVCGEKSFSVPSPFLLSGSPPRVRGKARRKRVSGNGDGITPACAGKSAALPQQPRQGWDHPRVCGEKGRRSSRGVCSSGSPPRVRGKVVFSLSRPLCGRITPACAGKRRIVGNYERATTDHPRVCGEKIILSRLATLAAGSPPRVRGKALAVAHVLMRGRITPACAGKSSRRPDHPCRRRDHPRVCGEKLTLRRRTIHEFGSPPRVRGKGAGSGAEKKAYGITPACAGKSDGPLKAAAAGWDHPRVCGEKKAGDVDGFFASGSPPRVRGKGFCRAGK